MGIINKITNGVTDKVGKKVLDIEEINEKISYLKMKKKLHNVEKS